MPQDEKTTPSMPIGARERELEEKLGARTMAVIALSFVVIIQLVVIVRLAT